MNWLSIIIQNLQNLRIAKKFEEINKISKQRLASVRVVSG